LADSAAEVHLDRPESFRRVRQRGGRCRELDCAAAEYRAERSLAQEDREGMEARNEESGGRRKEHG
jgi:hypothetical protein